MARQAKVKIRRLGEYRWEVSNESGSGVVYATQELMEQLRGDAALVQVVNVSSLPGLVGPSMAMPDCHYGYGFAIGGVAATDVERGVVSPGGVGYDINCGVRLLRSNLRHDEIKERVADLVRAIYQSVPAGVGEKGRVRATDAELTRVMEKGARWAVEQGMGEADDLEHCEENGAMPGADPDAVSQRARQRGRPQLGTLGAGNHFLEVQVVDEVYDEQVASAFGIDGPGAITVMIHTGSRGFGHQVCDDYIEQMQAAVRRYGIELPDPQLCCAPVESDEGRRYLGAMACAANYAWANRQCITHWTREAFSKVLSASPAASGLQVVYDVAHNIAKIEIHTGGPDLPEDERRQRRVCVHRKGATRAFGPGRPEVPEAYRSHGQPVIVPGDMGTASYLLVGTEEAMRATWGSTCHGAGRAMSRHKALKTKRAEQVLAELREQGIFVKAAGKRTVAEEMPEAYKSIHAVVETCHGAGISRKVCRMRPLGVMKG
ncbi:MAG: RtcB family protein [Armatimonadota bacterium]